MKTIKDPMKLTPREIRVLKLVAKGLTNREVAQHSFVTEDTVKFHLKNTYLKLGANRRVQAVLRAQRLGIVELPRSSPS